MLRPTGSLALPTVDRNISSGPITLNGVTYSGTPGGANLNGRPTFTSIEASPGRLKKGFGVTPQSTQLNFDNRALQQMRADNLRAPGEQSQMRQLMQKQINRQAGDVTQNIASQQQRALDNMAMRGGVGAGAAERLAQAGVRDSLAAQQNIYGMGLQADIADEQMRQQGLANLNQAEMGFAGLDLGNQQFNAGQNMAAQQFNSAALQNNAARQAAFDMGLYSEKMRDQAAKATAAAAPSSSGGKK